MRIRRVAGLLSFLLVTVPTWADASSEWQQISDLTERIDETAITLKRFGGASRKKQKFESEFSSMLLLLSGWLDRYIASYPEDENHAEVRANRLLVAVELNEKADHDYD